MQIEFEVPKGDTDELANELDKAEVDYDVRTVSRMGGVLETVAFFVPLSADALTLCQTFWTMRPWTKPISIVVVNGGDRVVVESAEIDAKEIVVRLTAYSTSVEIKR
ncbi:hypothetical protein ELG88_08535 [Rhizobium leguminosarum]|uniref:hypothetical protein n=1 Tax=Rhizobium leguminosarum TaxID=384 RepID=UPI00102FDA78|nr:hypothetical protein [Rhizobium leguminosarum]TBF35259.1 hypothetical protein ELG88_08535 [Rhizobium leguminosarum]